MSEKEELKGKGDLESQLQALKACSLEELRTHWQLRFRKAFPAHLPRYLLINLLAYRIQADAFGDIGPAELRYFSLLTPQSGHKAGRFRRLIQEERQLQPGTVFIRQHAGEFHHVTQTDNGFHWNGKEYNSLSTVAFAITGTKWNGFRFFGIPKGKRRGRS